MRQLRVVIMRMMRDTHGTTNGLADSSRHATRLNAECELSRGRPAARIVRRASEVDRCNLRFRLLSGDV